MYADSSGPRRNSFGVDGVSINDLKQDQQASLFKLSRAIRSLGYQPSPLLPHFIPKPDGKDRVICVPTVSDRLVQRALLAQLIGEGYGFNNAISYGFVKGRSVRHAALRAVELRGQCPWAYKADISSFFDMIDRQHLMDVVRTKVGLRSLHPIIRLIASTEISYRNYSVEKRVRKIGIERGVGLRQGMPLSPYLANVMLISFDRAVEKKRIPMVRYADDIIAFANSREECEDIHNFCSGLLEEIGLSVHRLGESSKTQIVEPAEVVEFLGLGLERAKAGYRLVVTQRQLDAIKQKIFNFSDLDFCLSNKITLSKLMSKINNSVDGYREAYKLCDNSLHLDHVLESAKSQVLKTLFSKHFGIDFSALSAKKKEFLEV